ncbi:MAG: hypothetical protein GX115_00475 [Ruminiclostridium sp.]|nr:hypothetical protein [Ruminiclostridium sp.]
MYKSGQCAAILTEMGDSTYYNILNLSDEDSNNHTYTEFPLFQENKASRLSPLFLSFVISGQSRNKERVLMFLDWIQSSQENYRLFRYGLEGRDYNLVNQSVSMLQTSESLDDMFVNWYGGKAIMNMELEDPYWMGDRSQDSTQQWEEVCKNTEYPPHSGFLPDYNAAYNCFNTRRSTYNETLMRMKSRQYQQEDSEKYIEKMKKAGTDAFVQGIQQQLDQWRKENMQ